MNDLSTGTNGLVAWQRVKGAIVLFFAPDLSFVAYLFGPRVGALGYNLVHVFAFGIVLLAAGLAIGAATLSALGTLWLAHSGFDRMLGYGLKSTEGFDLTHLGPIGGSREEADRSAATRVCSSLS